MIVGAPVIAAPTDDEAEYLASSTYQRVLGIITGRRGLLPRPIENYAAQLGEQERRAIGDFLAVASIGGPDKVRTRLQKLQADTEADELILVSDVYDRDLRLRSLEITAGVMGR